MRFLARPSLSIAIHGLILGLLPATPTLAANSSDAGWVRPHIRFTEIADGADPSAHLDATEACLDFLNQSLAAAPHFRKWKPIVIQTLQLTPQLPIAGGSASGAVTALTGKADATVSCHETFHLFQQQTLAEIPFPRGENGKASPLLEALPQIASIVSTGDCLIGRLGRGPIPYDHCRPIPWSQLPSLAQTRLQEEQELTKAGIDPGEYYRQPLPADVLSRPSAYYSSIPLGYALFRSFQTNSCDRVKLLTALEVTWYEEGLARNQKTFNSILDFTPAFLLRVERFAGRDCADTVRGFALPLDLLSEPRS